MKESVKFMKKNYRKLLLIAIFDVLFVLLLVNLRIVLSNFNVWFFNLALQAGGFAQTFSLFFLIAVGVLLFIVTYSLFKYLVLNFVIEIFKGPALKFNRFFMFLKINLVVFLVIGILSALFVLPTYFHLKNLIIEANPIKVLVNALIMIVIGLIIFVYCYNLLNLFHSIFVKERSVKKLIKESFIRSFKLNSYKVYWPNLKILLAFGIFLLIVHMFMKIFVLTDVQAYLKYNGYYKFILISLSVLVGYVLLMFNRLKLLYR